MTSLWDFAGSLYQQPGVQDYCINLQDNHGVDVCVLLAMVWYGNYGERIDEPRMSALIASTKSWREAFVVKLRELRKPLAPAGVEYANIAPPDIATVYTAIKQLELLAEKATLNSIATNFPLVSLAACHAEQRTKSIRLNVRCYLSGFTALPNTAVVSISKVLIGGASSM